MRKLTNEEVIKEFINRLKTRKSNFYVEYHDGKLNKINAEGIDIYLTDKMVDFGDAFELQKTYVDFSDSEDTSAHLISLINQVRAFVNVLQEIDESEKRKNDCKKK